MTRVCECVIEAQGRIVRITFNNGTTARFHALWLRDNALDASTRDRRNGQRLLTLAQIPADSRVSAWRIRGEYLELDFEPQGMCASWPAPWLLAHIYDRNDDRPSGWLATGVQHWDGTFDALATVAAFAALRSETAALRGWLAHVRRSGFALVRDAPTSTGAVLEVAALFGFVRETNYGRWFDVRTEVNPTNLAYTGLGLQAHTDNPYRDPAPTLQILLCLENSAVGGESVVVDGFAVARRLQLSAPHAFDLLSRYCARFAYLGGDAVELRARKPMIELAPDGELIAVRFNNRSTAPIVDVPFAEMPAYYEAYRAFEALVDDPAMAVSFKLEPGEAFVIDNTRVLHARTGYAGVGSRWLQGCYADKDGLLSTLAVLERDACGRA